jgi:hypothetical protein
MNEAPTRPHASLEKSLNQHTGIRQSDITRLERVASLERKFNLKPGQGESLARIPEVGKLAKYDGQTLEAKSEAVIEPITNENRTPLLNPTLNQTAGVIPVSGFTPAGFLSPGEEAAQLNSSLPSIAPPNLNRNGFNQATINSLLAGQNAINIPQIPNVQPGINLNIDGITRPQNEVTTFIPGSNVDLTKASFSSPEAISNQIPELSTIQNIESLLPQIKLPEQITQIKNEFKSHLNSGENLEQAVAALAPAKMELPKTNRVAEIISNIPGLSTQEIWHNAAKGGGFFNALQADWNQSFGRGKKEEVQSSIQSLDTNVIANRPPKVEVGTAPNPATPREEIANVALARENTSTSPETSQPRNEQQISAEQKIMAVQQILQTNLDPKIQLEMIANLLIELPQTTSQAETSTSTNGEIPVGTAQELINPEGIEPATTQQPNLNQPALQQVQPVAGLLSPARENPFRNESQKFELPQARADTVAKLGENYKDFTAKFDEPKTLKDFENKQAINQTVYDIAAGLDRNEFYKSIGVETNSNLSQQQENQRYQSLLSQVVIQGLSLSEGNLQQIINAGGKPESLLSGNQELSAILNNGIANYKLNSKAQKIEQQAGKSPNPEYSNIFYGKAFTYNLFQYDPNEVFTTDPQLAFILANILHSVNLPNGQKPYTYQQIRDLAASGDLAKNNALMSQIGKAAGDVFRTSR